MMERMMIGSLQLNRTTTGKPVVDLFSDDTRLQFPELRLFNLGSLETVGLDPNDLVAGERVYRRFWAYYELSDKRNERGNPYKDVRYLEPIDTPATATSVDTSAILAELREIRALLDSLAVALNEYYLPDRPNNTNVDLCPNCATRPCVCDDLDKAILRYANGQPCGDNDAEIAAFQAYVDAEHRLPTDLDELRDWYQTANGA